MTKRQPWRRWTNGLHCRKREKESASGIRINYDEWRTPFNPFLASEGGREDMVAVNATPYQSLKQSGCNRMLFLLVMPLESVRFLWLQMQLEQLTALLIALNGLRLTWACRWHLQTINLLLRKIWNNKNDTNYYHLTNATTIRGSFKGFLSSSVKNRLL